MIGRPDNLPSYSGDSRTKSWLRVAALVTTSLSSLESTADEAAMAGEPGARDARIYTANSFASRPARVVTSQPPHALGTP